MSKPHKRNPTASAVANQTERLGDALKEAAALPPCRARLHEPVICFTQQQIFFEPLLSYRENPCGASVRSIPPRCLKDEIVARQSRILKAWNRLM